jgi:hypothetical protein
LPASSPACPTSGGLAARFPNQLLSALAREQRYASIFRMQFFAVKVGKMLQVIHNLSTPAMAPHDESFAVFPGNFCVSGELGIFLSRTYCFNVESGEVSG